MLAYRQVDYLVDPLEWSQANHGTNRKMVAKYDRAEISTSAVVSWTLLALMSSYRSLRKSLLGPAMGCRGEIVPRPKP